mgnify:CR=1 FL=1
MPTVRDTGGNFVSPSSSGIGPYDPADPESGWFGPGVERMYASDIPGGPGFEGAQGDGIYGLQLFGRWEMRALQINGACDTAGEQTTSCSFTVEFKLIGYAISEEGPDARPYPEFELALDAAAVAAGRITCPTAPIALMPATVIESSYDPGSGLWTYQIDWIAEFTVVPGCDADYELVIEPSDITINPATQGAWTKTPMPGVSETDIGVLFLCAACDTSKPTGPITPGGGKNANDQSIGNATVASLEETAKDSDELSCLGCHADGPYFWNDTPYHFLWGPRGPGWEHMDSILMGETQAQFDAAADPPRLDSDPDGTWTPTLFFGPSTTSTSGNTNRPSPRTSSGFGGEDSGTTDGSGGTGTYSVSRVEIEVLSDMAGECTPDSIGGCVAVASCVLDFKVRAIGSYVSSDASYKGPDLDYGPSAGRFWRPRPPNQSFAESASGVDLPPYEKTPGAQTGPDVSGHYVTQCVWEWGFFYEPGCGGSAQFEVGANHFSTALDASTKTDVTPARVALIQMGCTECADDPNDPFDNDPDDVDPADAGTGEANLPIPGG